jgi:UDP-N-acetylmuramoyl-tripeptide--D-alanyl-D-alanine ligase
MEEIYEALKQNNFKFTTDTRKEVSGLGYFAIKGENFDGNEFVEDALEKGAVFVVTNRKNLAEKAENIFYTKDTEKLLAELGNYHRSLFDIPIIALTGSNGKTTTKELLRAVLSKKYNVLATKGNLNNQLGVPYTLLSITPETEIAVIEMGANHVGEIGELCEIAMPTHGLITNIGKAHIGEFGGMEGIKKAKGDMYDYLQKTGGVIFADQDEPNLQEMLAQRGITDAQEYKKDFDVTLKLFGAHNMQNAQAACTLGTYFDVPEKDILDALSSYESESDRSRAFKTEKGNTIIADMYNANPSSVEAGLREFAKQPGEKIAILGDMLELGEYSEAEHQGIVDLVQELGVTKAFLVGSEFQKATCGFEKFANADECAEFVSQQGIKDSSIFIKGSRGIALEKILGKEVL